jgi:hypothetical protein
MKKVLVGGLLLMSLTPSLYAGSVNCRDVQSRTVGIENKIYTFSATAECTAKADDIQVNTIHDAVFAALKDNGSVGDENGSKFSFVDKTFDSGHGSITVSYNSSLTSNRNTVVYHAVSSNIDADGYAANTESVKVDIKYTVSNGSVKLNINKTVEIKKPRLAPGFESKAQEGLRNEVSMIVDIHKAVLEGL